MDYKAPIVALCLVFLLGCGVPTPTIPVEIRCPAAPPDADIKCESCAAIAMRDHPENPESIEQLQSRYLVLLADYMDVRAAYENCRVTNQGCVWRNSVWDGSWEGCGGDGN